jgi:hypothetical protein
LVTGFAAAFGAGLTAFLAVGLVFNLSFGAALAEAALALTFALAAGAFFAFEVGIFCLSPFFRCS